MREAMTLQEISDRFELAELAARYARAVDNGEWDLLDTVFTADAEIDLSGPGGPKGSVEEVKAWLAKVLPAWPGRQHFIGHVSVVFDGDTATATIPFTDALSSSREAIGKDTPGLIRGGGVYHHRLVRTADGWRSRGVVAEQQWRTMR